MENQEMKLREIACSFPQRHSSRVRVLCARRAVCTGPEGQSTQGTLFTLGHTHEAALTGTRADSPLAATGIPAPPAHVTAAGPWPEQDGRLHTGLSPSSTPARPSGSTADTASTPTLPTPHRAQHRGSTQGTRPRAPVGSCSRAKQPSSCRYLVGNRRSPTDAASR